jgi:hypothetical protein
MTERLPDLAALVTFDDLLREVPTDRPALERAAALASEQLEDPAADERERLLILGYWEMSSESWGDMGKRSSHCGSASS